MTRTPGTWRVERVSHADSAGAGLPHYRIVAGSDVLAGLSRDNPLAAEDAALMAASPRLLAACRLALSEMDAAMRASDECSEAYLALYDAVEIAEGREP